MRWTDKRDIYALTTVLDVMTKVNRQDDIKVNCLEDYNSFMGGADVPDQYVSNYRAGRKSMKC